MKITVDQECLDQGRPGSTLHCPVALAMRKAGLERVSARQAWLQWWPDGAPFATSRKPPEDVALFMRKYDQRPFEKDLAKECWTLEPFSFELEV